MKLNKAKNFKLACKFYYWVLKLQYLADFIFGSRTRSKLEECLGHWTFYMEVRLGKMASVKTSYEGLLPSADRVGEYACSTAAISKILEVTSLSCIMQTKMEGQVNRRAPLIHDKPLSRITEQTKMLSQTSFSILCILKC